MMQTLIKRLTPFILLGMFFVLLTFGVLLFAYLFLFGTVIGLVLFITQWIRNKWLQNQPPQKTSPRQKIRIIDLKDWKRH